ncbi:Radial spoke head protein 9 [Pleodorina starrii]|uniref:Radial spoke head protein 9 homolog n=1 Tax=Pleodorina starrii TaxID=330485 RepID=A0A9W6F125_9CHLO|nr:Radial spoke head protein 9 [Pleodorina starrii]GLC52437.1 Radial spoke head protein 9 [Pleodorina starrii]GLC74902.1 Radial spoke head protein 9 [Pleodorina starrii]
MVQLEPNFTLVLKHLASCGAVIPAEQQAALDHSLPIKRIEAGLKTLVLWGRITALNGKDYLIAEGFNTATSKDGLATYETKYFYSQDGARWSDLQPVDPDTAVRCARIKGQLSGDAAKNYELTEKDPNAPEPVEGEEQEKEPEPLVFQISELSVLRYRVDSITAATSVIPTDSTIVNAASQVVPNRLFAGCAYPEKLEAYQHRTAAPGSGATLAQDLRGTWCVHYDSFKGVAQVRSLLWPGYFFYYAANELTWGALYVGDGNRNNDLIFML